MAKNDFTTQERDLLDEISRRDRARTAKRSSKQPYFTSPQFKARPTNEADLLAKGYRKYRVPGGIEWRKPHEITPTDFDAETDAPTSSDNGSKPKRARWQGPNYPSYRCPLCHAPECSC